VAKNSATGLHKLEVQGQKLQPKTPLDTTVVVLGVQLSHPIVTEMIKYLATKEMK